MRHVGLNLAALRSQRNLSQEELATKAGLSRVALANIEGGKSQPKPDTLYALADALEVQIENLLEERRPLEHVRFRSSSKLKSRDLVLAQIGHWLTGYRELEQILDVVQHSRLPTKAYGRGKEAARLAAADMRRHCGIAEDAPIRNIGGLLEEKLGICLLLKPVQTEGFFGLSVSPDDGGPAIVVNSWDRISVERWIFSAAHELGHLVLHLRAYRVAEEAEDESQEVEANEFASHFLMPSASFKIEWQRSRGLALVDQVLHLKRIFMVSYQTVLRRIDEENPTRPGLPSVWVRFLAEHKRRTNRPLPRTEEPDALRQNAFCSVMAAEEPRSLVEADLMETRLKTLVRTALDRDLITMTKAADLLGLDLLRMRDLSNMWIED